MKLLTTLLLGLSCFSSSLFAAQTRQVGLSFHERMEGEVSFNNHVLPAYFELDITIDDIKAWEESPDHKAYVFGAMFISEKRYPVEGSLALMKKVGHGSYELIYHLQALTSDAPFDSYLGTKLVHNDAGFDLLEDATSLYGQITWLANGTAIRKERGDFHFVWQSVSNVASFLNSFEAINAPTWRESMSAKWTFFRIWFGGMADAFLDPYRRFITGT